MNRITNQSERADKNAEARGNTAAKSQATVDGQPKEAKFTLAELFLIQKEAVRATVRR